MLSSRIFRESALLVSAPFGATLPSNVCDSDTLTRWVASLRSCSGWPGWATARANSSGTSAAGW